MSALGLGTWAPIQLLLIGPPGAGKGTQAVRLGMALGIPVISTGDMLRKAVQSDSLLGRAVKEVMERGELVGDGLMTDVVAHRLAKPDVAGGFILDGFPRTVHQAVALERLLGNRSRPHVVELSVPDDAIVQRLSARRVCGSCGANALPGALASGAQRCPCGGTLQARADDREDVVRDRLRVYKRATQPLIMFYAQRGCLSVVDGTLAADRVTNHVARLVAVGV